MLESMRQVENWHFTSADCTSAPGPSIPSSIGQLHEFTDMQVLYAYQQSSKLYRRKLLLITALLFILFTTKSIYFSGSQVSWPLSKANKTALLENLIVHYVRLLPEGPRVSKPPVQSPLNFLNQTFNELNFLDCMSILSVQVNLRPAAIYIHTNIPSSQGHWPNTSCNRWIKDWSKVHFIPIKLKHTTAGQKIKDIQHEADIAKLEAVFKYGGLALDFDVYILNGNLLRHKLLTTPCLSCHEDPKEGNDKINAGFLGCLEPKAEFPGRVLDVYRKDFRPNEWVYNSGEQPFWIMVEHPHSVTLDDYVCNEPEWIYRHMDLYENNKWQNMTAYHSYFHMFPGAFSQEDFERTQIFLLSDMIRWFAAKVGINIPINYA